MSRTVLFSVLALAEPGLLPRVMVPFARRDVTPDHLSARRSGEAILVEIAVSEISETDVRLVEGNLRQLVGLLQLSCEAVPLQQAA
jgi:hypothetical protein